MSRSHRFRAAPVPGRARRGPPQALVAYARNSYSVAPELARTVVVVQVRLGAAHLGVSTATEHTMEVLPASHRLAPAGTGTGTGVMVRDHGHVLALDTAAMASATSAQPHQGKVRIPPRPRCRRSR